MIWLALVAWAGDEPPVTLDVGGDVKAFMVATFPYDHALMPPDPVGQGVGAFRLKVEGAWKDRVDLSFHPILVATGGQGTGGLTGTGVGLGAPEAVDLSWEAVDADGLTVLGRVDRAVLTGHFGPVDVAFGRQPVTFGTGLVFTPMDVVNPFTPATVDTEYKPGVDALRVDVYPSFSSRITVVAAYSGDWSADGTVLAATGQGTVGVTDVLGFAALAHGEPVLGAGLVTAVGPVGLHGDLTVTVPKDAGAIRDPYVRAVLGADARPSGKSSLGAEVYLQTFGETCPRDALVLASDEAYGRGELWATGLVEVALTGSYELTPTTAASLAVIGNVTDPSALIAPGLSWSVAENADVLLGGYFGAGARPREARFVDANGVPLQGDRLLRNLGVRSEYGLVPSTGFLAIRAYF